MEKKDVIEKILGQRQYIPRQDTATAFAPANIALCKYWGKRNSLINLPCTSSISISLGDQGTTTSITPIDSHGDIFYVNGQHIPLTSKFAARMQQFLDLFRYPQKKFFEIKTISTLPIGAGFATSASGYAALILALNTLFDWKLSKKNLSILARMGSGSASRSLWQGFVLWRMGSLKNGMDSYASPIPLVWPQLRIGLITISDQEKKWDSSTGMALSLQSPFYRCWIRKTQQDCLAIKKTIKDQDFSQFGALVESNALAMHSLIQTSWPPIYYTLPQTLAVIHRIWELRDQGLGVYFTQDAGPNLKLLFLADNEKDVAQFFPKLQIVNPFAYLS